MPDSGNGAERRVHTHIRSIFPAACAVLQPFFETANQWEGQSQDHLAYQTLREHFPELTAQDVFIVVSTTRRLFASGKFPPTA